MGNWCCCEKMTEETQRIAYQYPFHSKESDKFANHNDNRNPKETYQAFGHTFGDLIDEHDLV
jgi:hypothetical protein